MIISKLRLPEWTAIFEILASIAVIISLVFVAQSINRNTVELQAANVNDLYDAIREMDSSAMADAELSSLIYRVMNGDFDSLTPEEKHRYSFYAIQHLSIWEQTFARARDGTIGPEIYDSWQAYFERFTRQTLPDEIWAGRRAWFDEEFQVEVDHALRGNE